MILENERAAVCEYARRLTADGLVVGTSGNVSARSGDLVAVTPTGVDYAALTPADIPVVDLDGKLADGALKPTSELPMHLAVYTRATDPESAPVNAVVHTHSVHATAVSTLVTEVPPIHYMLAAIGPTAQWPRTRPTAPPNSPTPCCRPWTLAEAASWQTTARSPSAIRWRVRTAGRSNWNGSARCGWRLGPPVLRICCHQRKSSTWWRS